MFTLEDHVEKILRNKLGELLRDHPSFSELKTLCPSLSFVQDLTTLKAQVVKEEVPEGTTGPNGEQFTHCTQLKISLSIPVAPTASYDSCLENDLHCV